jgi:hypothetical protein
MNVVPLPRRLCQGCGRELEPDARAGKRYHGPACRQAGRRRRQRLELERRFAEDASEQSRREMLAKATSEDALTFQLAKAASNGNVRSAIYLMERLYPRGVPVDERQGDELAALRARLEGRRR